MKDYERVSAAGHQLVCFVCRGDEFERRTMTLVTSGWANSGFNKSGELAVCARCGYVHTFFQGAPLVWHRVEHPET
jgi:hypothetical protein